MTHIPRRTFLKATLGGTAGLVALPDIFGGSLLGASSPNGSGALEDRLSIQTGALSDYKRVSSFGFNTCHAVLAMRSDLQEHMARANRELGMRYWRCHGTLSDDVGVATKGPSGEIRYTFSGLKRILDKGLSQGMKPFFEISFMPSALARDASKTVCHYRAVTSPPADWDQWRDLIAKLMGFLVDTYGLEELRKWYFEVWNEPNIPFWAGTQAEYFRLYRDVALALKAADPQLRVGGPATARGEWVADLLAFCGQTRTPIDFVSTHIYPSDVAFSDSAQGAVKRLGTEYLHENVVRVQREVSAHSPALPIIWGEWNSSAGPFAESHDECNNAALISAALAMFEDHSNGSLFWNLSDIYEEAQYHFSPFHGGYGLYTVDGIAKSAARAFEFWHSLNGQRAQIDGLPATCARGAFATHDVATNQTQVLLWNHLEPGTTGSDWALSLEVKGSAARSAAVLAVVPENGSAYEKWISMGRPLNLSVAQRGALEEASQPLASLVDANAKSVFSLKIAPGTLTKLTLK